MKSVTLNEALEIVNRLSATDQQRLLGELQRRADVAGDDWALQGDQLAFMVNHHDQIENAYASGDIEALRQIEASEEYQTLFGDMPWDEAYDRYEETWWSDDDESHDP